MRPLLTPKSKHTRSHSGTGGVIPLPASLQRLLDRAEALNMLVGDILLHLRPNLAEQQRQSQDPLEHVLPFGLKIHGERIVERTQPTTSTLGQVSL